MRTASTLCKAYYIHTYNRKREREKKNRKRRKKIIVDNRREAAKRNDGKKPMQIFIDWYEAKWEKNGTCGERERGRSLNYICKWERWCNGREVAWRKKFRERIFSVNGICVIFFCHFIYIFSVSDSHCCCIFVTIQMVLDCLSVCLFSSLNLLLLHWTIWTENRILITQRAKKSEAK